MTVASPSPAPLAGIRVLDLSRILAGPWAAQVLADLGAEVIKVERPGLGDDTRSWGPPYAKPEGTVPSGEASDGPGEAAYFLSANRGKSSLAVDIKSAEGAALLRDLAARSDVLIENFKLGDLARYGLDAETLRAANPGLVYCSITGFGQSGPRAHQAGYDLMIQGMAGLMSVTGRPDGEPGGGPMKVGVALVDVLTGLNAAIGILAALIERRESGRGRHLELALYDVCAASLANQAMNYLVGGQVPGRMGNRHPNIAPYETFAAADGHLILAVGNDAQFRKLCAVIGLDALADDPRFATNAARVANRAVLGERIAAVFATATRADWIERLEAVGVPCGPINDLAEVFADPHAQARGLVRRLPHASLGALPCVAAPLRFDGVPAMSGRAAPLLGEHSRAVLRDLLDLGAAEIGALEAAGAIAARPEREGCDGR